jgi:hypothetical protein
MMRVLAILFTVRILATVCSVATQAIDRPFAVIDG